MTFAFLHVDLLTQFDRLVAQLNTDTSGKWMSVDNAEKFALLVIQAYNKELKEDQRKISRNLGYSRIGLKNI